MTTILESVRAFMAEEFKGGAANISDLISACQEAESRKDLASIVEDINNQKLKEDATTLLQNGFDEGVEPELISLKLVKLLEKHEGSRNDANLTDINQQRAARSKKLESYERNLLGEYYDSGWQEVDSKPVKDWDDFWTDYTWYVDATDHHVFIFGDKDIYGPEDTPDHEVDGNYAEAEEWFLTYEGPNGGEDDYEECFSLSKVAEAMAWEDDDYDDDDDWGTPRLSSSTPTDRAGEWSTLRYKNSEDLNEDANKTIIVPITNKVEKICAKLGYDIVDLPTTDRALEKDMGHDHYNKIPADENCIIIDAKGWPELVDALKDFNVLNEALAPKDNPNIQNGFVAKPYWYFTKHGVQPGSVPKGVEIEEIKDTEHGTYFSTYYLLTTQELKDFDIKEERPQLDESNINTLGEKFVELRSVNGHRIFRCKDDKGNTYYDVYDKAFEFFESFKTLKEAKKFAMNWLEEEVDVDNTIFEESLSEGAVKYGTARNPKIVSKEEVRDMMDSGYEVGHIKDAVTWDIVDKYITDNFGNNVTVCSYVNNTSQTEPSDLFVLFKESLNEHFMLKRRKEDILRDIEWYEKIIENPNGPQARNHMVNLGPHGDVVKSAQNHIKGLKRALDSGDFVESLNEDAGYFGLIDKFMFSELVDVTKASSKEEAEKYFGRFSILDDTLYVREISERTYNIFNDRASTYNESLNKKITSKSDWVKAFNECASMSDFGLLTENFSNIKAVPTKAFKEVVAARNVAFKRLKKNESLNEDAGGKVYTVFAKNDDMTFIMHEEENKLSVTGWYFGEPDAEATQIYDGNLVAEFPDDNSYNEDLVEKPSDQEIRIAQRDIEKEYGKCMYSKFSGDRLYFINKNGDEVSIARRLNEGAEKLVNKNNGLEYTHRSDTFNEAEYDYYRLGYISRVNCSATTYYKHARGNNGYKYYVKQHHPYDDAEYSWAFSDDGRSWSVVKSRKVVDHIDTQLEDFKAVAEYIVERDKDVKSKMIHN